MKIIENNLVVSIEKVIPNNYNPKLDYKESEELKREYEKIKKSLKVHGQVDPILIRENEDGKLEIVNGFHRWTAMKELGFKEIEVKNLGKISRNEAIKIALSTEETRIPLDVIEVAQLIKGLKEIGEDLKDLPYTLEEIKDKMELLEFDWKKFTGEEIDVVEVPEGDVRSFEVPKSKLKEIEDFVSKKKVENREGIKEEEKKIRLLGTTKIRVTELQAEVIWKAFNKLKKETNIDIMGRVLELICADYLGGK